MEQVRLGKTGLKVSRLCLGCMTYGSPEWRTWVLDEAQSKPFFQSAIEKGITFFDTANVYSIGASEEVTGHWLREFARREEIVVATKVNGPMGKGPNEKGLSRKSIMAQIDASLTRLGMDYVDLYHIHRFDYEVPIEETLEALNDVVKAGKARYIGASSMHAHQFKQALDVSAKNGWASFISMQDQYNLIQREEENEMHPLCLQENIAVLPWSPLARGKLTRPWGETTARSVSDKFASQLYDATGAADAKIAERVAKVAEDHGVPRAQIALAWLLAKPAVTAPIIGASRAEHLDDAIAALQVKLSREEIAELEMAYQPHVATGFQ